MKTFDEWWEENKPNNEIFKLSETALMIVKQLCLKSRIDSIQPYINAMNEFCNEFEVFGTGKRYYYVKFCELLEREPK